MIMIKEDTESAMRKQMQNQKTSSQEPTLGERIKLKRAREGLSQSQASQAWGIPKRALQCWEQGIRTPRGFTLHALEKILKE